MDAGILSALRKRYRRKQMERTVDLADENIRDMYKIDILAALNWIKRIWEDLPAVFIRNCWTHTCSLEDSSTDIAIGEEALDMKICNNIGVLVPERVPTSLADLLNPVGEDECLQEEDDAGMVADIVGSFMSDTVEEGEENKDHSVLSRLLSAQEQLRALASTKRILAPEFRLHYSFTSPYEGSESCSQHDFIEIKADYD